MTTSPEASLSVDVEPLRPLGVHGLAVWRSATPLTLTRPALEMLQILCEQIDERIALRVIVLRGGLADDRRALRALDAQIDEALDWLDAEVSRAAMTQEVSLVDELSRRRETRLAGASTPPSSGRRGQQRRSGGR